MNRRWVIQSVLLGLLMGLLTPFWSEAAHTPEQIPIFTSAEVDTTVTFDPTSGLYTYNYTLTNPSSNTGEIDLFEVDISLPPASAPLPSIGLTFDKGELSDGTRYLYPFEENIPFYQNDPDYAPAVPVGTQMPFAGFSTDVHVGAGLFWMTEPTPPPGTSYGPLQVFSLGLPTIRIFFVSPAFFPTGEAGSEEAENDLRIFEELKVPGRTLGPTAPPAVFDSVVFLETIRGYVTESQTLGWLTDAGLVAALNGALDAAAAGVSSNDVGATKTALLAFIAALPVPPAGTTACSTECAGLLYFNAQYLLDQLPTVPDLTVTQVSASQETVAVGANVDVTVTVYNAGGGSADPSSARLLLSSDATISLSDTSLGDIAIPALALGTSQTITTPMTLPSTTPPGAYTLGACADSTGIVTELSETNNCAAGGTLTVTMPDDSDEEALTATATPNTLWPPSHKMVPVTVSVAAIEGTDLSGTCQIASVSSNEPDNGLGDGDTATDWEITGPVTADLRAERSGTGSGRIYTMTVECTDVAGNVVSATTTVTVPLN
jgi:hypothetical protein